MDGARNRIAGYCIDELCGIALAADSSCGQGVGPEPTRIDYGTPSRTPYSTKKNSSIGVSVVKEVHHDGKARRQDWHHHWRR